MRRIALPERPGWRALADAQGFAFHSFGPEPYWDETGAYAFTLEEIERDLEAPTAALHALCLDLVDRAVRDESLLARLRIPEGAWDVIAASWRRGDPSLYGRFDLAYGGSGPAKLLEYNADTPTSLYETGAFQWLWLEELIAAGALPPDADQFNSVHDKLVARLAALRDAPLHLACMGGEAEDRGTVRYLEDCAAQAGLEARFLDIAEVGLGPDGRFVGRDGEGIARLFKLYPWEWMFAEAFAAALPATSTRFLEPPWKAVLSNKGVLPLLWAMEPGHPNLLEAYFEDDPARAALGSSYARKPLYSREGANVLLVRDGARLGREEGPYGAEGRVRQALAQLPRFHGRHAVVGSWVVGDEPAGISIRESDGPVTTNRSRFVPHAILDGDPGLASSVGEG